MYKLDKKRKNSNFGIQFASDNSSFNQLQNEPELSNGDMDKKPAVVDHKEALPFGQVDACDDDKSNERERHKGKPTTAKQHRMSGPVQGRDEICRKVVSFADIPRGVVSKLAPPRQPGLAQKGD